METRERMNDTDLQRFALEGARVQLARIYELFPQLREGGGEVAPTPRQKRAPMSAARKRELSRRMKAIWKARKAGMRTKGAGR